MFYSSDTDLVIPSSSTYSLQNPSYGLSCLCPLFLINLFSSLEASCHTSGWAVTYLDFPGAYLLFSLGHSYFTYTSTQHIWCIWDMTPPLCIMKICICTRFQEILKNKVSLWGIRNGPIFFLLESTIFTEQHIALDLKITPADNWTILIK